MAKSSSEAAPSTFGSKVITFLAVMASIAGIVGTVWTIGTGLLDTAQGNIDPTPSATVTPAPSVTYRPLEDFEDDDARLAYAADLLGQNQPQAAEAFLSDFLAAVESGSQLAAAIRYDRGLAHLYLKDYNQAIVDLSAVITQAEYPDAYYNLGNAYAGLEDDESALAAYEHAIALEQKPEYTDARDAALARLAPEPT